MSYIYIYSNTLGCWLSHSIGLVKLHHQYSENISKCYKKVTWSECIGKYLAHSSSTLSINASETLRVKSEGILWFRGRQLHIAAIGHLLYKGYWKILPTRFLIFLLALERKEVQLNYLKMTEIIHL